MSKHLVIIGVGTVVILLVASGLIADCGFAHTARTLKIASLLVSGATFLKWGIQ